MNIIYLTSTLDSEGIRVAKAVGSDFSPVLIEAAAQEAKRFLSAENQRKVQFCVAKNETLTDDVSGSLGVEKLQLKGSFDFIFGVNTFRYCHRAKKELDCAQAIFELLTPGGICVMIDMNNRFPLFRSALKDPQSAKKEECYLPTLDEYTSPFAKAGFDVLRSEHFCWVPHSAGQLMTGFLSLMTPILNLVARSRAMRSLVVAKKPESARTASASK